MSVSGHATQGMLVGRKGHRQRIDTGIFRDDSGGFSIIAYGVERRMPADSSKAKLYRRRAELIEELEAQQPALGAPVGTLRRDIPRYLQLAKHLSRTDTQSAHLRAWLPRLGDHTRRSITRHDILDVRGEWIDKGIKPKTCNNRVSALRALYRTLDGEDASTPCDKVKPLPVHRTPAVSVPAFDILEIDMRLQEQERKGFLRDAKTRARFRVRAATGRRPSEIMRAECTDVDLKRRIWTPRDGKGGFTPGIYLTDDMIAAWELFIEADAWGEFDTYSMARVLRTSGWNRAIRPYNLRHSVGIALSESGVDLADVQQMMGHKHQATTRQHYVPVLASRLQRAAELLEGRLKWETVPRDGSTSDMEPRGNTRKKQQSLRAVAPRKKGRKSRD